MAKKATTKTERSNSRREPKSPNSEAAPQADAGPLIDARIRELDDWRATILSRARTIIRSADPAVFEEWKWGGPVWSHPSCGIICTGETYKRAVKLTFANGASLPDPSGLFNSSLDGNTRRAIDLHEGDEIDERALKAIIRAAAKTAGSKKS
jgi:hypothetical protein